jgi:Icc protein
MLHAIRTINVSTAEPRTLRVVQLSDTHLFADPSRCLAGLNTQMSFRQTLELLKSRHWPADLVLATGDLVHDGSPSGYARLRSQLAALEVPVYCIPGNHDESEQLRRGVNRGPVRWVPYARHGAWAFVFLDSTVPGSDGGHLSRAELARLERALDRHPDLQVLVALHHQPVPIGSDWLDTMAVDNRAALFRILDRATQVRGVVWGHVHQGFEQQRNGVRLLGAPSTCVQFRPGAATFALDHATPGYRWLELHPDGRIETGVERLETYPAEFDLLSGGRY